MGTPGEGSLHYTSVQIEAFPILQNFTAPNENHEGFRFGIFAGGQQGPTRLLKAKPLQPIEEYDCQLHAEVCGPYCGRTSSVT